MLIDKKSPEISCVDNSREDPNETLMDNQNLDNEPEIAPKNDSENLILTKKKIEVEDLESNLVWADRVDEARDNIAEHTFEKDYDYYYWMGTTVYELGHKPGEIQPKITEDPMMYRNGVPKFKICEDAEEAKKVFFGNSAA
jgi:hypothetical protein